MFTGIVEAVGTVVSLEDLDDLRRLTVEAPEVAAGVRVGDSIAVNGACLTVTSVGGGRFSFDAIRETLDRTNVGELRVGGRANLERSMRADGRFDGHIVQGHVDETGIVARLERSDRDVRVHVDTSPEFAELLVEKGSVTIDGVSLTVVGVRADGFDTALIPHTLEVTTLGELRPGDRVNLEADILGKYVKRQLDAQLRASR
ncbi:MAG: riboflavin synthase [Deltaproteobacteria bacterium]|nr:MAG: riboflavin synthase [Deltaproteobacteria bacterium]